MVRTYVKFIDRWKNPLVSERSANTLVNSPMRIAEIWAKIKGISSPELPPSVFFSFSEKCSVVDHGRERENFEFTIDSFEILFQTIFYLLDRRIIR